MAYRELQQEEGANVGVAVAILYIFSFKVQNNGQNL